MFRILRNKKGQSTAEYAVLIGLVIAAMLAMQTYVKRGVQGKMKSVSDDFTSQIGAQRQFEPDYLSSQSTQESSDYEKSTMDTGGTVTREVEKKTKQAAGDYQKVTYP